jgi:hypothetical protein
MLRIYWANTLLNFNKLQSEVTGDPNPLLHSNVQMQLLYRTPLSPSSIYITMYNQNHSNIPTKTPKSNSRNINVYYKYSPKAELKQMKFQ